ncbi:MAG: Maf family protein [Thermoflexales bacterium]
MRLVLASASPRRRELLSSLGLAFEVCPPHVAEEPLPGETPLQTQERITRDKAAVAQRQIGDPQAAIVACDTTVLLLDGTMLNKPRNAPEARAMLRTLRQQGEHVVQSVLVTRHGQREMLSVVTSQVFMRPYTDVEMDAYIASGEPFDKAGGYAVQDAHFRPVLRIVGCPLNVVGLPLCCLRQHLPSLPNPAAVCQARFGGIICPAVRCEVTII